MATLALDYLLQEQIYKTDSNTLISKYSNIGANPIKGPTPKSLFYEAAKRNPGKYGQFLFYSLGSFDNLVDPYYRSESVSYNKRVSSIASKNPSAGMLVRETMGNEEVVNKSTKELKGLVSGMTFTGNIIGGLSAPYYWKDFLYCKYYGTIPNNYMITLRRFPTPVLDNMSVPEAIKGTDSFHKEGAGRPVAQAITWFGGNTGNSLTSLLSFSSGIAWGPREQESVKTQQGYSKGLFSDDGRGPMSLIGVSLDKLNSNLGSGYKAVTAIAKGLTLATDPSETVTKAMKAKELRDKAKDNKDNMMSEYAWTSLDVVRKTQVREIGLPFNWDSLSVVFEYELASVGEVNSKAAMLDILANLLSIGTNYGNFLTPDVRYDAGAETFPAINFPGGNAGLEAYYRDPVKWFIDYSSEIGNIVSGTGTNNAEDENKKVDDIRVKLSNILQESGNDPNKLKERFQDIKNEVGGSIGRLIRLAVTGDYLSSYVAPLSLLTGAPVGEWHLTIGNPCNPIAMIGNLVCSGVKIDFSESLGPDDFPTGLKATFTLQHGREREKGEIESIFNRGNGRLYQSSLSTSASAVSFASFGDVNGNVLSEYYKNSYLDGDSWRKGQGPAQEAANLLGFQ
jgi:hypothetical protein